MDAVNPLPIAVPVARVTAVTESSAQERVALALDALATSAAPIQARLVNAGVALAPLGEDAFEEDENRETYAQVMALLSNAGSIESTAVRLDDQEAVAIARQIVALDAACRPLG